MGLMRNHVTQRIDDLIFELVSEALGFFHMHQVYNRDDFIDIYWENVEVGKEIQFRKYTNLELTLSDSNYDYSSIMHYGAYYFSKNGRPTIVPKVSELFHIAPTWWIIIHRFHFPYSRIINTLKLLDNTNIWATKIFGNSMRCTNVTKKYIHDEQFRTNILEE